MPEDDAIAALSVGLNEDAKAARKKGGKSKPEAAGDDAAQLATDSGATSEEAAALGTVVEEAVASAIEPDQAEDAADKPHPTATRIEVTQEQAMAMAADRLAGGLLERLLDLYKTRVKPFAQEPEDGQKQIINALRNAVRDTMKEAVWIISEASDNGFEAKLEKYTDAGGLKIALSAESTWENVKACHAAQGLFVTVRQVDPSPFMNEAGGPVPEPDQPEMAFEADRGDPKPALDEDAMFAKAVDMVTRERKASTSWLQRQFSVGYNVAHQIVERMEREGIVSAPDALGRREVLRDAPDDSDLADPFSSDTDAKPKPDDGEALFGVFAADDGEWLASYTDDGDAWTPSASDAGQWPQGEADILAAKFAGNVVVRALP